MLKKKNYFFEMLKDVWKIWPWYIASVIATAAYLILDMISRSTLGKVTDAAIAHTPAFLPNLILMVSVVLAAAPFHSLSTYTKAYMSQHMMEHLRVRIGEKAAHISLPALERRHSGDILNFLGDELRQLDGFVYYGMSVLTHVTTVLVGTSIFMFCIDAQLTLVLYGIALLVLPASIFLSRPIKSHQMQMRAMMGKAQTSAREGLQSLLVVKSFRLEDVMADRYWAALGRALHFDLRNKRVISLMISIGIALGLVPLIAMLILGGYRILQGTLSIGQLLSLSLLGKTFIDEVADAPSLLTYIQRARAACERIYGFLDEPDEPNGTMTTPDSRQPVLEITDLQFGYPGRPPLFDGLSLRLERGRTIALVGPSGCGKSTLIKLICGFEQPQGGAARIFGHPTSAWELGSLRDNIALVSQESFLFQGTLRENLLSARAGATDEELLAACDRADIGALVRARRLDADVGELGKTLSGGERQRIAIARAMLKDAPLLLLDEPTSSLDATTELAVQRSLERLMKGRTTLIITHRLSSIRNADCIYVMDRGRIVQQGIHEALADTEGLYRQLYQQQLIESEAV